MPSYKLIYFNARGRGEMIRLIFAAAGVQYEDCRMTKEEFLKLKEGTVYYNDDILIYRPCYLVLLLMNVLHSISSAIAYFSFKQVLLLIYSYSHGTNFALQ